MKSDAQMFNEIKKNYGGGYRDDVNLPGGMILMAMPGGPNGMPGFGGQAVITGDEVETSESGKIAIPAGMTYRQVIDIMKRLEEENETVTRFNRAFPYRPNDGAYATYKVLRRRYGMVMGKTLQTLFGDRPPELRDVKVGPNKTEQLPWGCITIPTMPGSELELCGYHCDDEGFPIFDIHVSVARKHRREIEEMFDEIEEYLRTDSIYRGKAVRGVNNLDFLELENFDASQIVFSTGVKQSLEGNLWSMLRYTQTMRDEKIPLRKTVLLHGPYGTGKTSVGMMTGQLAVKYGWTFIAAKAGKDNITDVMQLAQQYQPAVVFFEDLDTQADASNGDSETSKLLDVFDGIASKDGEIIVVMTTNHVDRVQKGMMRPGRLDVLVEIAELDRNGTEQLIKAVVAPERLDPAIDYDAVFTAMNGFLPAFVRGAVDRARSFAINRQEGARDYVLTTDDLVMAATSLHPQLQALNDAKESERPPTIDQAITAAITSATGGIVHGAELHHENGGKLVVHVPSMNGSKH